MQPGVGVDLTARREATSGAASVPRRLPGHQFSVLWQELLQLRLDAFQPIVETRFLTPLLCLVASTVLVL